MLDSAQTAANSGLHRWRHQDYTIRFRAGDLYLFGVKRKAQVRQTHFTRETGSVEALRLPAAEGADLFYVPSFPASPELLELSTAGGMLRYCLRRYLRHYIQVEGDFKSYLARFSAKSRKTLKRKAVLWSERNNGESGMRLYHRPDQMAEYASHCRQISARTYQELVSGDGFPRGDAFVEELRQMAADGRIRGYVLFAGERPAAYAYCFVPLGAPEVLQYDTVGYDPDDKHWSPGTVLLFHILDDVYQRQTTEIFDFGIGDHAYKRFFATHSIEAADLLYLPLNARNRMLIGAHYWLRKMTRGIRKVSDALGLSERVRRLVRVMR